QGPYGFHAEAVVPEEDVPDTGDEHPAPVTPVLKGTHPSSSSDVTSSVRKYRKLPCARRMSAPGSSSTVTARYTEPSTSCRTARTVAERRRRNWSWASVRLRPGASRTRLPGPTGRPATTTRWYAGSTAVASTGPPC